MPAFISQRDPRSPWWERRGAQDLPCVLLPWQLASPPSCVPQQAGTAGSVALVTLRRAVQCVLWISAVILLGTSMFIVFAEGEQQLWEWRKAYETWISARKCNTELQHRTEDVNANVNVNLVQTPWGGIRKRTSFASLAFQLKACFSLT